MIPLRNTRRFLYKTYRQPGYALRVFRKRLFAYFYYKFTDGKSCYPEAITFFLTHRCNLHCRMCGQWGESGITKRQSSQYIKEELSFDEIKAVIDNVAMFKPNITLFGGEPLLYQAGVETIRYIKQNKMHCLMITNGSLLDSLAEQIVDSGLDELNVSLDGGKELHDEIRGMPGLFDEIMDGLKKINFFKRQRHNYKPIINLQCTVTNYNYKHLEQLIDVANEADADSLTFHNLIFLEQALIERQKEYDALLGCSSSDWQGFVFEPGIDSDLLYEKIKKILSGKYKFNVDFYPNFSQSALRQYYRNPNFMPSGYAGRCLSPWVVTYIFPDGEIRPCLNFTYSYGNIKNNKFTEIWNSQKAIRFRLLLKEKKILPLCVRCTELYRY